MDKILLTESEQKKLDNLVSEKEIYLKYKSLSINDLLIRGLMDKFEVNSIENILRSAYFYGFIEFKDKKYQQEIFKIANEQNRRFCEYRKILLKIGFKCPEELSIFFFNIYKLKQDNFDESIKIAVKQLQNSDNVKEYLKEFTTFINSLSNDERAEFLQTYRQCFAIKENQKISFEMKGIFNNIAAGIACQIRNYIDDVFPIFISDSLTKDEYKFIDFLVSEGDGIDYIRRYNKTVDWLERMKRKLIRKYSTKNLTELVVIHLIEKNYHADNRAYLNLLLNINIDNVIKNLKLISRLIIRTNKPKIEQIMTSLNDLRVNTSETITISHNYRQLAKLLNEALKQNII